MKTIRVSCARLLASVSVCCVIGAVLPANAQDQGGLENFPDGSTGQITEFKGVNDTRIAAYLRKPKGDGPFPAVVIMHGGGESTQGTYWLGRMETAPVARFIAEGWAVYSIDFRPKSSFLPIDWDDACLAVETLRKMPFIDGRRVAMTGNSHGGYNSVRAAARCDLSCAVPSAPAGLDLIEVAKAQQAGVKINQALVGMIQRMEKDYGAPVARIIENPASFKHESAFTEVERVRCPMLLISAKDDPASPPSAIEAFAKKLRTAGKEVEIYLPETGGHGFYFGRPQPTPETEEATGRAVAFIKKHFAAAAPDAARSAAIAAPAATAKGATEPVPPVCYDITKSFPGEIGQYRVSRESRPVEPFEILDGLYYVGNSQVSAHLLTTTNGLVLMDSTMPHQVSWLLESIRKLGFDPRDVKVVIGNHAHLDHIGGHWYFQHYFGAQTWLHEADAAATETSAWQPGKPVPLDGTLQAISVAFPPFKTDRKLRDGETIEWGGRKFTFHLAAGHTPGTLFTQFPLREKSSGQIVTAGMLGGFSLGRPGFAETVAKLRAMDVQLVLGAHPNQNQTFEKQRRLQSGAQTNPFVDPASWAQFLDRLDRVAPASRRPPTTTSSKK